MAEVVGGGHERRHAARLVGERASGGALVTLDTDVEPADPATADNVTAMIEEAFGRSLASLRRWIEDRQRWDAT